MTEQTAQIMRDLGIAAVCYGLVIAMICTAIEHIADWVKKRRKQRGH